MSSQQITMISIDDRSLLTELDRSGYKKMGVIVQSAATYQDVAKSLAGGVGDVVVINADLESIDAASVCEHLKKAYPMVPVVITSVQSSVKNRQSALNAGADLFVEQPVPREYFIEKLKILLEHQTRTNDRIEFQGSAVVTTDSGSQTIVIGDLSSSGLLLETELDLSPGTIVKLKFHVPGEKESIQVTGEVVRRIEHDPKAPQQKSGVGVRFVEFSSDSEKRLEAFIAQSTVQDARLAYYL